MNKVARLRRGQRNLPPVRQGAGEQLNLIARACSIWDAVHPRLSTAESKRAQYPEMEHADALRVFS